MGGGEGKDGCSARWVGRVLMFVVFFIVERLFIGAPLFYV